MYYLEVKETAAAGGKQTAIWKPVCYASRKEPLDEKVAGLGSEEYRVTIAVERRKSAQ